MWFCVFLYIYHQLMHVWVRNKVKVLISVILFRYSWGCFTGFMLVSLFLCCCNRVVYYKWVCPRHMPQIRWLSNLAGFFFSIHLSVDNMYSRQSYKQDRQQRYSGLKKKTIVVKLLTNNQLIELLKKIKVNFIESKLLGRKCLTSSMFSSSNNVLIIPCSQYQ